MHWLAPPACYAWVACGSVAMDGRRNCCFGKHDLPLEWHMGLSFGVAHGAVASPTPYLGGNSLAYT